MEIVFKASVSDTSITLRPMEPFDSGYAFQFPNRASDDCATLIEDFYRFAVEMLQLRLKRFGESSGKEA